MQLATIPQNLTMTSREIAELTGKDHKHVLTDIRKMLEELGIDSAGFSAEYKDTTGRMLPAFGLPKRETMILVSGYSITMRAKIIDRWQELEAGKKSELNAFEFFELQGRLLTAKDQIIDLQRQILLSMQERKTQGSKKEKPFFERKSSEEFVFERVVSALKKHGVLPSWKITRMLKMSKSETAPYLQTMQDNGAIGVTAHQPASGKTRYSVMLA